VTFVSLDDYVALLLLALSGEVVIFYSPDSYVASFFQDMRDLYLFRRLCRFAFSVPVVIFPQKDRLLAYEVPRHK
jgi:hypothetical protein